MVDIFRFAKKMLIFCRNQKSYKNEQLQEITNSVEMNFLYVLLVISLIGCIKAQPLEDTEAGPEEFLEDIEDGEEYQTEYITNDTIETALDNEHLNETAIDVVNHRFGGNAASSKLGASCAIGLFFVEKVVQVKSKNKFNNKNQQRIILEKGSLTNCVSMFGGHYLITAASLVQNVQKPMVVKQSQTTLIRVKRVIIISGTNIALLRLCRKVTRVPSCTIAREQICPTTNCPAPGTTLQGYSYRSREYNPNPENTITQLQGNHVECPSNVQSSNCCFTSSQTLCQNDKGAGIYSSSNLIGIISSDNNCQAQQIYSYEKINSFAALKLYYGMTLTLDCDNCKYLPYITPEYI